MNKISFDQIDIEISKIFKTLLKKEVLIELDIIREKEPTWDSLLNLELIISLEDFFLIQFSPEEIESMDTKFKIQNIIVKKLHGNM